MNSSVSEVANRIGRALISASKRSLPTGTWSSSLEQTLHQLGCRDSLSPSLVARVIDPLLHGHLSLALGFFRWASQQPRFSHNYVTYGAMLKSLSVSRHFSAIDKLLKEAKARRIELEPDVYHSVIASNIKGRKTQTAFSIFKQASSLNSDIGPDTCNSLLAALASDGCIADAREVFIEMMRRSVYISTLGFGVFMLKFCRNAGVGEILSLLDEARKGVWLINGSIVTVLIVHGLCLESRAKEAFWMLDELRARECKPDFMAYRIVTEAFRLMGNVVDVQKVLKKKRKLGVAPRANDYKEFLLALMSERRIREANELGQIIVSGNFPIDDDALNALIESVSTVDPRSSILLLEFMIGKERLPSLVTLSNLSRNLCKQDKVDELMEVFQMLSVKEYFSDLESYIVMVSFLCKAGRIKEAYDVLQEMKKKGFCPDVSFYNCLMEACCREDLLRPAKRLWDEMFASGCPGNLKTYNILIQKVLEIGQVEEGQRLYSHMLEKGIEPDGMTYKSLLEGLCKERKPEGAIELFSRSIEHDTVLAQSILSTFILSLCEEGYFLEASRLLCSLVSDIADSNCHVTLLKSLIEATELPVASEHITWIGKNSPSLLLAISSALSELDLSLSKPEPVLDLLQAAQRRYLISDDDSSEHMFNR